MNIWLCYLWGKPVVISLSYVNNKAYMLFLQLIKVIRAVWGKHPEHYRELWKGTITLEFFLLGLECIQVCKRHLFLPLGRPSPPFFLTQAPDPPPLSVPGSNPDSGLFALVFLTQGKGWGVWTGWSPGALSPASS